MAWTNIHKQHMFETWFGVSSAPTVFYLLFATSATTPTADTSATAQLTLVPSGNGWPGSSILTPGTAQLLITRSDASDYAQADLSALIVSAIGGDVPITGDPMRWMLFAGLPGGSDKTYLYSFWSLGGNTTVATGQTFNITNGALRGTNA